MEKKSIKDFNFKKAAIYKIVVQGAINESWSDRMHGMQIKVEKRTDNIPFSSLVGEIRDQSALSSILNSLYDMHMTVISVNMLSDIEDK